jgi:putative addiction module component (TIGR02574 family)
MSTLTPALTEEILALPSEDRAYLAQRLLESLDAVPDPELDRLWAEEAERRVDASLAGKVKTTPADEVFAEIAARYRTINSQLTNEEKP